MKRPLRLSDLTGTEGMTMKDISRILGRNYDETKDFIWKNGLRQNYPRHGGEASHLARKGYCK